MTNPFQNFNDAMACVIERRGKAWRASGIVHYGPSVEHPEQGACTFVARDGSFYAKGFIFSQNDLTATDWVWEEAS